MKELQMFIESLISRDKTEDTIKNAKKFCNEFISVLNIQTKDDLNNISLSDIYSYLSVLSENNNAASTKVTKLNYVKMFLRYLYGIGVIDNIRYLENDNLKISVKKSLYKGVSYNDILRMIEYAKNKNDILYYILIKTMLVSGLRISELLNLKFENLHKDGIQVYGKGDKERFVIVDQDIMQEIIEYANPTREYVFVSSRGNKLQYANVSVKLKYIASSLGIDFTLVSPHKIRHEFATALLSKDVPIDVVAEMLGHSNISTTRIYAKTTSDRVRSAMKNINMMELS